MSGFLYVVLAENQASCLRHNLVLYRIANLAGMLFREGRAVFLKLLVGLALACFGTSDAIDGDESL